MILALVSDLLFESRIHAVAAAVGVAVRAVRTAEAARALLWSQPSDSPAGGRITGLIVDLDLAGGSGLALAVDAKRDQPHLPVVGFFPHVQAELARKARAAGVERALPRSKFAEDLPELLRELAGTARP